MGGTVRVVFMGTAEFAVPSLRALASSHEVVTVYTRPDAVSGRGGRVRPSPVKEAALELGLPLRQTPALTDPSELDALRSFGADVICVAAYGLILPGAVLAMPRYGALNVHASLLPRWRGAAPIQRAILAGDEKTGVTIMRVEEGLDTGPYSESLEVPVDDFSYQELTLQLAQLGAAALIETLEQVREESIEWTPQDESKATYAAKLTKADVALAPDLAVVEAARRVRASSPQAPSRIRVGDATLTILRAVPVEPNAPESAEAGRVRIENQRVLIGLSDGSLELMVVRPEGRRDMPATAWARGARLAPDTPWDAVK